MIFWVLVFIILLVVFYKVFSNISYALAFASISTVIFILRLYFKKKSNIKNYWDTNKLMKNKIEKYSFYNHCFKSSSKIGYSEINYDKLYKIVETDSNFYFMIAINQGFIIVKDDCSDELIDFIRSWGLKINSRMIK